MAFAGTRSACAFACAHPRTISSSHPPLTSPFSHHSIPGHMNRRHQGYRLRAHSRQHSSSLLDENSLCQSKLDRRHRVSMREIDHKCHVHYNVCILPPLPPCSRNCDTQLFVDVTLNRRPILRLRISSYGSSRQTLTSFSR